MQYTCVRACVRAKHACCDSETKRKLSEHLLTSSGRIRVLHIYTPVYVFCHTHYTYIHMML